MYKLIFALSLSVLITACQSTEPTETPVYKEKPAITNKNNLKDLSLGLHLHEVRAHMGNTPIYNAINPKKAFKNPVVTHTFTNIKGQNIVIDVYVTYAANLGSCPENTYKTEPTVFINGILVAIGWEFVIKNKNTLGVNQLWIRRGRDYDFQQDCS